MDNKENFVFSFSNHWNENDEGYWEFASEELNRIFPHAIYSMSSKSFGWNRDIVCRIIDGNGEKLLHLTFDATFEIYRYDDYWTVKIYFHDSPMGDLFTIRKHDTRDEAEAHLRGLGHRI